MKENIIRETRNESKKNVRYMDYRITEITKMLNQKLEKYSGNNK